MSTRIDHDSPQRWLVSEDPIPLVELQLKIIRKIITDRQSGANDVDSDSASKAPMDKEPDLKVK